MLLFAFRKLPAKWLLVFSLAIVCCGMIQSALRWADTREKRAGYLEAMQAKKENKKLTPEQQGAIGAWTQIEKRQVPDTAEMNMHMREMHSGYPTIFKAFIPFNAENEASGTYYGIWDMLAIDVYGHGAFCLWLFYQ